MIHHRHKLTPYEGEVLRGVVEKTFLRGQMVYDDGRFFGPSVARLRSNYQYRGAALMLKSLARRSSNLMDFTELIDLASERLGGAVLFANDDFFAPKENLLKPSRPGFHRRQIHRPRQMDGRLGVAAPPHARI